MPNAEIEVVVEPGEPTDDGADLSSSSSRRTRASAPGRWPRPRPAASSPGDAGAACGALGGAADPGVRRGRRRDRRRGGVAVGRLLQTLGSRHQVLCVTHLAQVAAFADTQVVVEKAVELRRAGTERTVAHARRSSTATRGSPSSRACSRASATRRTPAATPPSCSTTAAASGAARRPRQAAADGAAAASRKTARRAVRDPGHRAGRPAHQGPHPAAAAGRDRGDRPQRPRPRRRRRPHRGGRASRW